MFNKQWKGNPKEIHYLRRPFILRPEREGIHSWIEVLRKLGISRGNPTWVDQFIPQMKATGKQVGIEFDFNTNVGNSMSSLQLMHHFLLLEKSGNIPRGTQEVLALRLGVGHFEKKRCVADMDVLKSEASDILKSINCSNLVEEALSVIDTNKHYDDVIKAIDREHRKGHHSIPVVEVNGIQLHGARSAEEYFEAIWEAAEETEK